MRFKDKIRDNNRDRYFEALAMIESSGNPNAKAPTSSAAGLYQFTKGTWNELVSRMGLDYTEDDRYDPEKSRLVVERFTQQNERYLQNALDREIKPNELYISHFLGMGGARKLLKAYEENPNASVKGIVDPSSINANRNVFYDKDGNLKSVKQIYNWSKEKIRQYMPEPEEESYDFYNDPEELFTPENTIQNRRSQEYAPKQIIDIPQEELHPFVYETTRNKPEEKEIIKQSKEELERRQRGFIQKLIKATEVQYIDPNETEETTYGHIPQYQQGGNVRYGTKEYEQAYRDGTFAHVPNQLDEVTINVDRNTGRNIEEQYPYYNELTPQEREYWNDSSPIGRAVRRKAQTNRELSEDALQIGSQLFQGAISAGQIPQSAMVEGVEALRGRPSDLSSSLPGNNQRLPSEAWGYQNPEGIVQNVANIGLDIVADPLNLVGAGLIDNKTINTLKRVYKMPNTEDVIKTLYDEILYPVAYGKSKMDLRRYANNEIEFLKRSPEAKKRIEGLGIDYDKFVEHIDKMQVKSRPGEGSFMRSPRMDYYDVITETIKKFDEPALMNIDFRQIDDKGFKEHLGKGSGFREVFDHELGHGLQYKPNMRNVPYKELNQQEVMLYKGLDREIPNDVSTRATAPTSIDQELGKLKPKENLNEVQRNNLEYFMNASRSYGTDIDNSVERLPFLMEYRRQMMNAGILKNRYDKITPDMINKFFKSNPDNRINSFIENTPENKIILLKMLRRLPATVTGAALLENKPEAKRGRKIKK